MELNQLAVLDCFSMAFKLINRIEGLKVTPFDEEYRSALREIAEGRLTLIDDEFIRRGQGNPFLEQWIVAERERAALILEGMEVVEQ